MESKIESWVKQCQRSHPVESVATLHLWEWPRQPWHRMHLDFAWPFMGSMFLIVIDEHSKWLDVSVTQSITSSTTIKRLQVHLCYSWSTTHLSNK